MLVLDAQGHLVPYTLIQTDWQAFVTTFGWNEHRQQLIYSLQTFADYLGTLVINSFTLWLDGSFVTAKDQPNDLDVVVFLTTPDHRKHEHTLRAVRDQFIGLDMYFVRSIGEQEQDYFLFAADRIEWTFQFTTTRPDRRTYQKFPKGFIQITWGDE